MVDLTFNNKFYTDVPIGLTTKDSRSTFLINRDLLTRFKVNVKQIESLFFHIGLKEAMAMIQERVNLTLEKDNSCFTNKVNYVIIINNEKE